MGTENGLIYSTGRSDSQVKVRGQRVNLAEIEKTLLDCLQDQVAKAVVLVLNPREDSQRIVAFMVLKSPSSAKMADLKTILENSLPLFMMPILFEIQELPLLVNG